MNEEVFTQQDNVLLHISAYVLLGVIATAALLNTETTVDRWIIVAVLLTFAVVMTRSPEDDAPARDRHLYLGIQSCIVLSALILLSPFFALLFFVLSVEAMLMLPTRKGLLWIAGFAVVTTTAYLLSEQNMVGALLQSLVNSAGFLFFGVFGRALARAEDARQESERLLAELQEAHKQLQAYAEHAEELAIVKERNRLAREMHDTLGHRLTVAAVQLEGAQRLISDEPARASRMVGTVREQVREALKELRSTVATLRTPLEADLSLATALSRLVSEFDSATALRVHAELPEDGTLEVTGPHQHALYRAAQEGLTNVQRHAHAQDVWLQLRRHNGHITLQVSDNGVGMADDAGQAGFGLRGLRERAAQLNGDLRVEPRAEGGTQLTFSLPYPPESGLEDDDG